MIRGRSNDNARPNPRESLPSIRRFFHPFATRRPAVSLVSCRFAELDLRSLAWSLIFSIQGNVPTSRGLPARGMRAGDQVCFFFRFC